jgi:serralysin
MAGTSSYNPKSGLDWGTRVPGDNTIEVYFAPKGAKIRDGYGGVYTSDGFTLYEIRQFQRAFALIEASVAIDFVRVGSRAAADFVIGLDANGEMSRDTLGWMNPPGEAFGGSAMFNGLAWDRGPGGDLSVGGYGFVTIVHELLHGLGLAHPFDDGGTSTVFPGVRYGSNDLGTALLNQGVFTTMSYNSGFVAGPVGYSAFDHRIWNHGYEAGPSPLDIAVLQEKYGANGATRSGDTTYTLPDVNKIGTAYRGIWDTGGTDTIQYLGGRDTTINLRAATLNYERGGGGFISAADGVAGGVTIAAGVVIENARSARGDDTLVGNGVANRLAAGGGNDTLYGLGGDDLLFAGAGNDTVRAGNGNDTVRGYAGADTVYGGIGRDTLFGDTGNDRLFAETGNDTGWGGAGNDRLAGGDGDDVLGGGPGADVVFGGNGADTIFGSSGNDQLNGGPGADTFQFFAGTGRDRVFGFVIGEDRIHFDPELWGGEVRSAAEIADAAHVTENGVVWWFGNGNIVLLVGLADTVGLEGSILI